MALRSGRPSAPYLCMEAWLGPMEGSRVCATAVDGCVVRLGRRRADEKRGLKNDFVLAEGDGISGFHAEVRCERGRIFLKDLDSTNGTFAGGHRVSGEIEIQDGDIFLLSTTPLRAFFSDDGAAAPTPPSKEDLGASVPFQELFAETAAVAVRRGEGYVDTRHLAEALLESKDEGIARALRSSGLSSDRSQKDLWQGGIFREPLHWLRPFLTSPDPAASPRGNPSISPRVRELFGAAVLRLAGYPEAEAKTLAATALFAALASGKGPVASWLQEAGVRPEPVPPPRRPAARKTRGPRPSATIPLPDEPTIRQAPGESTSTATRVVPSRSERPLREKDFGTTAPVRQLSRERTPVAARVTGLPPVPTTGDALLDQRARAIAIELEEAATLYRFSTAEDRRSVMKTLVQRALAAVAPENRGRILSQIRVQFPVVALPPPEVSDETPKLRARIRELERRIEELAREREREPRKGPSAPDTAWKSLVAPPGAAPPSPEVEVLRAALSFARNLEKFLLGLIQGSTVPGNVTTSFRLSLYRYTLEEVLQSVQEGEVIGVEGLQDYLRELERWQVAILASHHESPRVWFEKLWKKANPSVIEASSGKSGTWKIGGQATEWWNRYKEVVRGLNPEVVQDQVLQTANKIAQEELQKLSKRKN